MGEEEVLVVVVEELEILTKVVTKVMVRGTKLEEVASEIWHCQTRGKPV